MARIPVTTRPTHSARRCSASAPWIVRSATDSSAAGGLGVSVSARRNVPVIARYTTRAVTAEIKMATIARAKRRWRLVFAEDDDFLTGGGNPPQVSSGT